MTITNRTAYEPEIAALAAPQQFLNGAVEDVAIYPTALSAQSILTHYQAAAAPQPSPPPTAGSYAANVALDNPLADWRLNESGGQTAVDRSGLNNPGTYNTGVTLRNTAGPLTNDNETAATLDGVSGYVSIPDNASLLNTPVISVEAWIKATSWVASASIVNRRTTANVGGFTLEVGNTSGQINFWVYVAGGWRVATTPAPTLGLWHYIVGTYDGGAVRVYADGGPPASTSIGGTDNSPAAPPGGVRKNRSNRHRDSFNGPPPQEP